MVDFRPGVPEAERCNWEAALHDVGLLDAQVTVDGRLIGMDDASAAVQLASREMQPLAEPLQLARVLKLSPSSADRSAYVETLSHLLMVIGVGHDAGQTWVAADGCWRNGPLHGKLASAP